MAVPIDRVSVTMAMRLHMQTVDSSCFAGFVDRRFLASRFSSCMLPLRTPHTSKVNGLMMVMVPVTHRVGIAEQSKLTMKAKGAFQLSTLISLSLQKTKDKLHQTAPGAIPKTAG